MQRQITHISVEAGTLARTLDVLTARAADLTRQLEEVRGMIAALRQQADASALAQQNETA